MEPDVCEKCGSELAMERHITNGRPSWHCIECHHDHPIRVVARFHSQAWVRDYAIDVDPEGPVEWDVTEEILALGRDVALGIEDDQYDSDELRHAKTAPKWIQDWSGPFYVEVAESVRKFFNYCETCRQPEHDVCSLTVGCPCCDDTIART